MTALASLRVRLKDVQGVRANLAAFERAIRSCDLLVVCGAGGFADSCREWNLYILAVMSTALKHRKKVAMFGQGIGPLNDPVVLSIARRILPKVCFIGLRGTQGDRELLKTIHVPPSKMVTTGDEALELATSVRSGQSRTAIGINLRVAFYSDVNADFIKELGTLLQAIAADHGASLAPLPIAFHACANDRETIRRLLEGFEGQVEDGTALDSPQSLIEQAARCRVVITGAYHAAVFALGQGVPTICLCNSPYYDAKFRGLAELFGRGCTIVNLSASNFAETLRTAIEDALGFSDDVRKQLLDATAMQIKCGRAAYEEIRSLVGAKFSVATDHVSSQADRVF